jgi:hypothetical protein
MHQIEEQAIARELARERERGRILENRRTRLINAIATVAPFVR